VDVAVDPERGLVTVVTGVEARCGREPDVASLVAAADALDAQQARVRGAGEDFEAIREAQAGRLPAGNWSRRELPPIPEMPG